MTNLSKFTDEELKEALATGVPMREFARQKGVGESTVRARKQKFIRQGWSPEHGLTHEIPDGYKLKGYSSYYGADGQIKGQWVKTNEDKERQIELMKEAIDALCDSLPRIEPTTIYNEHQLNDNLLAVYNWGDPHIGMMAWGEECGQDWDLKIAESVFCRAAHRIVTQAESSKEALIINLGDYLHADNVAGVTARNHHKLDVDGRYAKMARVAIKILRQIIESALTKHEKVSVINVSGNHDDIGAIWLSVALSHIYENEPRLHVLNNPTPFHYYRFGKVLIGTHHGHSTKHEKLPGVMATDKAKDWGETEFRYWFCGHVHHSSKKEYAGCTVETFRTLAPKDAYAAWGGYRAHQDTTCIMMHKEYGEVARHTKNIKMLLED